MLVNILADSVFFPSRDVKTSGSTSDNTGLDGEICLCFLNHENDKMMLYWPTAISICKVRNRSLKNERHDGTSTTYGRRINGHHRNFVT